MSGGHLCEYAQYRIEDIATAIEEEIAKRSKRRVTEWGVCKPYSKKTLREFKKGVILLRTAYVYAQRIDWLVSDDDGEESFHKRLKEELQEL